MNKSEQNFENLMVQVSEKRGFVWNSLSESYINAKKRFSLYQAWFQETMSLAFFEKNICKL